MRRLSAAVVVCLLAACTTGVPSPSPASSLSAPSPAASNTAPPSAAATGTPPPTSPIATDPATIEQRYREALPLFEYDAAAPLDVEIGEEPLTEAAFGARFAISFASPRGDRVTGSIGIPEGDGPFPAVIVMHGMPGSSDDLAQLVGDYPAAGVVALSIDAPFVRSGRQGEPQETLDDPAATRQDQVDLVLDLRRAVDVLQERKEVDPERIGFQGFSYGGTVGGLLAGVEPRIGAFVLAVADGGLVEHLHDPRDYRGSLGSVSDAEREAWIAALEPIEPIYFLGSATAPILFQSARGDEFVAVDAAERYHAAAPDASEVRWYESGHFLPPTAFCEASAWLDGHLDFSGLLNGC